MTDQTRTLLDADYIDYGYSDQPRLWAWRGERDGTAEAWVLLTPSLLTMLLHDWQRLRADTREETAEQILEQIRELVK